MRKAVILIDPMFLKQIMKLSIDLQWMIISVPDIGWFLGKSRLLCETKKLIVLAFCGDLTHHSETNTWKVK